MKKFPKDLIYYEKYVINKLSGTQETFEALGHFFYGGFMKEYKTNEELINYLISRNVRVLNKTKALEILERYSYYSVVNGYKNLFKDATNHYKANVTFEEIFAVYEFDKNIKSIFLRYVLEIEVIIKSIIANIIASRYGIKEYLDFENFDSSADKDLINSLIQSLEKEIENNYIKHSAVKHYKDNYGFVPPFVLTKIITFGDISRYYGLLKQEDRQKVSKYFKISDKVLKQILINLTLVRNIAAHSDRLFCYRSKFYISFKSIDPNYRYCNNFTNLYMVMKCMKCLLDNEKNNEFESLISFEIDQLSNKLQSISISDVLEIMGINE